MTKCFYQICLRVFKRNHRNHIIPEPTESLQSAVSHRTEKPGPMKKKNYAERQKIWKTQFTRKHVCVKLEAAGTKQGDFFQGEFYTLYAGFKLSSIKFISKFLSE